jgi:Tfp pilus assembly protein PilF
MAISRTIKLALIIPLFLILSQQVWAQSAAANTTDEISRGITLYKSGDHRGAVEILSVAVKKQKEKADAWHYLALAQMRLGDFRSARKSIENAIKLRPDHAPSHTGLAYLLLMINDHRKADRPY